MKLSKITLLVLMASLAATGCGKRKLAEKASEDPKPDPLAVTSATKDDAKEAFKGPLSIGVNEKYGKLMAAYNGDPAKATLKLTAAYTPASKKLTISKDYSSLRIVSANAEGKSEPLDMKTVKKIPTMTLGQQPVEIQVDEEKKQYVLKADTATDVDVTKAITVGLKSDDEKLKIDETSYELSPIVLLGKPEEQSQELVLDLSKGEVPTDLTLFSSYKGEEGDTTKPECALVSTNGIGEVKPITIGLDIASQDGVIDLSKIKLELAKIPAGETEFEIDCIREDASKNPSLIAITRTLGFKLKVIQPEVKKEEPKKEEAAEK